MYLNTTQQTKITKDTLILLAGLFYPALHNYIWRVIVAFTGMVGLHFSIETFDAIFWSIVILYVVITSHKAPIKVKTLITALTFVIVTLFSFAFTEYERFTVLVLFTMLVGTFSFFIQGSVIDLKNVSHKQLYVAAIATLMVSVAYSIYSIIFKKSTFEDNMDFAYSVLPSVLIIISWLFTDQDKRLAIVLSIIGTVFLLMQGTRGPLLCLAIFVCLMLYKKYGLRKIAFKVGPIMLILVILSSSQFVKSKLVAVSNKIDSTGFSSRFITMMIEGELSDGNGREAIKETLLEEIKENPFAIRGMYADRHGTRGLIDSEKNTIYEKGTYAHSFWIEMIYDWGVLFGGVILLIVSYMILRIIKESDKNDAYIVMLFVCTGFVHLFFSGSYLLSSEFFFLIGIAINYRQRTALLVED